MAKVDIFMQGKGGVSKSACASILFQHYMGKGLPVFGVDTDPTNQSLWDYSDNHENLDHMDVIFLDVYDPVTKLLNETLMDELVERIMAVRDDAHVIVDVGSSIYPPMLAYLAKNETIPFLLEAGHEVTAHMPVVAEDLEEVLRSIQEVSETLPEVGFVFWSNPYMGSILKAANGCRKVRKLAEAPGTSPMGNGYLGDDVEDYSALEQISIFKRLLEAGRVKGIVHIPDLCLNPAFREVLSMVFGLHYTFRTVLKHDPVLLGAMPNQRVRMFWRKMRDELDAVLRD